jgi:hypothetical protein
MSISVDYSHVEGSARSGVSAWGASVALGSSQLSCNVFELNGEEFEGQPFVFDNRIFSGT